MISRFFASPLFRRLLCCFLALATVCLCLAPALVQPAYALAGVDDATLAIGLLFCSWAGVTFATNQGAVTAVTSFLNSSVNGLKACSEVASKYVVDGSLALVQGVKDAFQSILPYINSTFRTPEGSTEGSLVGSVPLGVPIGIPSFADSSSASNLNYYSADLFAKGTYPISVSTSKGVFQLAPYFKESYEAKFGVYVVDPSGKTSLDSGHIFMFSTKFVDFTSYFVGNKLYFASHHIYNGKTYLATICAYIFTDVQDASFEFIGVEGYKSIFKKNPKITGKEVTDLAFAQPSSPAPNPTDPTDPSEPSTPTKDSILAGFKDPMFWGLMGMIAILKDLTGYDASKIDPEALLKELYDLLHKTQTVPEPKPTEAPEPTPTEQPQPEPKPSEATKPTTSPDTPTDPPSDAAPTFDGMMLPGLRNFFPFCIPFDLHDMMEALCADPEAPKFTFATSFLGKLYEVEIDLSSWDDVAVKIRYMVVAIYIVSLTVATRKFIKW